MATGLLTSAQCAIPAMCPQSDQQYSRARASAHTFPGILSKQQQTAVHVKTGCRECKQESRGQISTSGIELTAARPCPRKTGRQSVASQAAGAMRPTSRRCRQAPARENSCWRS